MTKRIGTVIRMLALECVDSSLASPNYVADFASNRGVELTRDEVIYISNKYELEFQDETDSN